jgi:hypothetical protein
MSNYSLTVGAGGILNYRYNATKEVGFHFHTLAEVGAPFQPWFRKEILRRGLTVAYGQDLDHAPWVVDIATKRTKSA